mgnify:CR=1 FL=1
MFPSPKASIEGKARNFSKSQSLFSGAKVGIFPSPRSSIEGESSEFFKSQSLYRGGELGIFPSPKVSGKMKKKPL